MFELNGKTLVSTDWHFGLKSNSESRLKICIDVMKAHLKEIQASGISNVICCGDVFHERNAINSNTLNVAYKCISALAKKCNVYIVAGNHDLYLKNSVDVASINIFKDIKNVHVILKPEPFIMNGKQCLFVPWLSQVDGLDAGSFDFLFGHFDVPAKFIIDNYVAAHAKKAKATAKTASLVDASLGGQPSENFAPEQQLSFVDLAKASGTIFAGHIHQHKEMVVKCKKFIFVGSPYQQNLGDYGCDCGYYVIDANGKYVFKTIDDAPKHVKLMMSDIAAVGHDSYDFSCVKGNIVQKVYDVDVPAVDDQKINQKIHDFMPYEELLPEYQVEVDSTIVDADERFSVDMIRKSKLEYIRAYIDSISQDALDEAKVDRGKLFDVMKKYYDAIAS